MPCPGLDVAGAKPGSQTVVSGPRLSHIPSPHVSEVFPHQGNRSEAVSGMWTLSCVDTRLRLYELYKLVLLMHICF